MLELTWLTFGVALMFLVTGAAYAFVGTPKYIRLLKKKANTYEAMLKAQSDLGEGFIITDSQKIIYANDACEDLTGYGHKELISMPSLLMLLTPEKRPMVTDLIQKRIKGHKVPSNHDISILKKDGEELDLLISVKEFKVDNRLRFVVLVRDISERKKSEYAKNEFVSWVSHQLRTPLAAQKWHLEMLLDEEDGPLNPEQKKTLHSMGRANHRMFGLISSLLNLAKIQMGTLVIETEPTNLPDLTESVIRELAPLIEPKNLQIKKNFDSSLPIANADPKIIRIILQNLMSNAAKYTPEDGTISISIDYKSGNAIIKVVDTGMGIPEEDQKKLFEKFFRGSNVAHTKGAGLGLHMAKEIIVKCGGTLECDSEEGKGTTFIVTLPLN